MKILLVDDHALFRDALGLLIGWRFPSVSTVHAGTVADAVARLEEESAIDVVLLDLSLPDSEGLATLQRVREAAPAHRIVVLSGDDHPGTVERAIELGAVGFVPKTAQRDTLEHALARILEGGVFLPQVVAAAQAAVQPAPPDLGLSPRQREVLRLVIEGKPNKLICRALDVSESTVKTHLEAIFRRLEVKSRTEAVVAAARLGWRVWDTAGSGPAADGAAAR